MSANYKVKVNNSIDFDINSESLSKFDAIPNSESKFHILQDNSSYEAEIIDADFNKKSYTVSINNNAYTVSINDDLDELIKQMGFEVGASKVVNEIKAPMPGLILEINIKPGQEVKEDDALLVLEAMKMENVLTSPRDGVIKSISVNKGDAVDKNQLLIAFDA